MPVKRTYRRRAPRKRVVRRVVTRKRVTRPRKMRGGAIPTWMRSIHDFVKKHKLISRIGSSLGAVGVPYASGVSKVASVLGYGRRSVRRGGALRLAGGGRILY